MQVRPNKKEPRAIDIHVGNRIRLRRLALDWSQTKLGEALDVSFQQVQKYEKGLNRVGASRLQRAAEVLSVSVSYFFEGGPETSNGGEQNAAVTSSDEMLQFLATEEGVALNRAFARLNDPQVRRKIVALVKALAPSDAALTPAMAFEE
ncbi:Cro/Cl family transcriptional regulator [Sinorhizobium fredii USDA 205]|uniref:Helix-turn-helix domain-containing protein n=1 Tax=Rhizobium fredii TaxID=380 RepID=A0A844A4D0_RHIFR|nr:helix-turn-helix transcriptional regulator [Sinorhizobium fredii]KSV85921.1 Cro/Cl family transcriptional regulator [Sinorhizobium fredii USDA 205]MQW96290.1 helix-turn-helix domain-containing protein [Sinorhizobium fredii]MQX07823.1 helix-turn-helix domain-containing protein [Sinorhizobium fredii]UTY45858.1 XRE family transcriptional regulator [Sinorhizobium fredii]WOS66447.1 helix-turn-helix transcriptional regulator [Sinorhizobium fredii GR64]